MAGAVTTGRGQCVPAPMTASLTVSKSVRESVGVMWCFVQERGAGTEAPSVIRTMFMCLYYHGKEGPAAWTDGAVGSGCGCFMYIQIPVGVTIIQLPS